MPNIPSPYIKRSRRQSIALQVTPGGELIVNAPLFTPNFIINQFIQRKSDWILDTLQKISIKKVRSKEYKEGEEFWYEGLPRELKFYDGIEVAVREDEILFPIALRFRIHKELTDWFIRQARNRISQRVSYHAGKMNARYKSLLFSDTKTKWGTCGPDNSLQFNWRLIMAPLMVMDYVVIHELAHTKEKNHGINFWREVGKYTPAFKQHRKWLNSNNHLLTV